MSESKRSKSFLGRIFNPFFRKSSSQPPEESRTKSKPHPQSPVAEKSRSSSDSARQSLLSPVDVTVSVHQNPLFRRKPVPLGRRQSAVLKISSNVGDLAHADIVSPAPEKRRPMTVALGELHTDGDALSVRAPRSPAPSVAAAAPPAETDTLMTRAPPATPADGSADAAPIAAEKTVSAVTPTTGTPLCKRPHLRRHPHL